MTILIPCGAKKREAACMAWDMYQGGYFKTLLDVACKLSKDVKIMSAGYGVLELNDVINPYNIRMTKEKAAWFRANNLMPLDADSFLPLLYRDACTGKITKLIPAGLGMGSQMKAARALVAADAPLLCNYRQLESGAVRTLLDIKGVA